MVRELPPGPADQCTTEELINFVANISLFTRGREPHEKDRLHARCKEASDVLKARGIPYVAMAHWNFGPSSREPRVPRDHYDPDWYKRPSDAQNQIGVGVRRSAEATQDPQESLIEYRQRRAAASHQQYLDYVKRFERLEKRKGWLRYMVRHPLAALIAMARRKPLPNDWYRQPLNEWDYEMEKALSYLKSISRSD